MKTFSSSKGFTLIELLVVIAIIGILATATAGLYLTSHQKARDANRISDLQVIKMALFQGYTDRSRYADASAAGFAQLEANKYFPERVQDGKSGKPAAKSGTDNSFLDYVYVTNNSGDYYEVSTAFEASGNVGAERKAGRDYGNDDDRFEIGNALSTLDTSLTVAGSPTDSNAFIID